MKKRGIHIIILYIIIFILVGINIISNKNIILDNNTMILKNMNESTQVSNLEKTIEDLNASHTEYANYIKTSKQEIANVINMYPNKNVTAENSFEELSIMLENLTNIPTGTYYYVEGTEGTQIERYKLENGLYYICNENGIVENSEIPTDVSSKKLIEYTPASNSNLNAGIASFVNKSLILGDGADNNKTCNFILNLKITCANTHSSYKGNPTSVYNVKLTYQNESLGVEYTASSSGYFNGPVYVGIQSIEFVSIEFI